MKRRVLLTIGLPLWVFVGFTIAQYLVIFAIEGLKALGVSFQSVNVTLFNTVGGVIIYGLAIALVLGLPWLIKRKKTSLKELGLQRLPRWLDMLWAPAGYAVYLILTSAVLFVATHVLTSINYSQPQVTGFSNLATRPEYFLAFVSLVVIAPFAEETLFRGYLFGKLRKYVPLWAAILITSAVFGAVHGQWNVGLDVFSLSIVLCLLRVYTGSLWASILLHMIKNGIAYYFLFIYH